MLKLLIACILLFTATIPGVQAQGLYDDYKKMNFSSKVTGQEYELFIAVPKSYKTKDTTTYPVLYVLDGNFMFPVMHTMQRLLSEIQEVQDIIVVGIGYHTSSILESTKFRTPDYTPTKDTAFERMLLDDIKMTVRTGEANKFLKTLQQDIFPLIEKNYRTRDRGLAGHSFGGLFGSYVLLNQPQLFKKYLLSSISIPWDNQVLLKQEASFFQAGHKELNAQVFVSVGDQETYMDMIPGMQKFMASLKGRNYQGLSIEERILPNETHASAFLTAFNQGLRVLYKNKRND